MQHHTVSALALAALATGPATAGVTEFHDRASWQAAVGDFMTITFTEIPVNVFVTDQYAHLGVIFTDGNDYTDASSVYVNDGFGMDGYPGGAINISFTTPQSWLAFDFPGFVQVEMFRNGRSVHITNWFGVGGVGNFGGLVSSEPFDAVRMFDPFDPIVLIDDLHFGVPAPGALVLIGVAALAPRRGLRRRAGAVMNQRRTRPGRG
jgi:hypothetical protein